MSGITTEGAGIDPTVYAINSQMLGGPAAAALQGGEKTGWEFEGSRPDQERVAEVLARVAARNATTDGGEIGKSGIHYGTPEYAALHGRVVERNTIRHTRLVAGGAAVIGRGVRLAM